MDYVLKKYIYRQYHIYIREAHVDTATYILHHIVTLNNNNLRLFYFYVAIYFEEEHTDITMLTEGTSTYTATQGYNELFVYYFVYSNWNYLNR